MKFGKFAFPALLALTVLTAAFCPKPVPVDKETVLLQTLMGALKNLHFDPQRLNDEFSTKVYDLYLDRLDNGRRFLVNEDVKALEKSKMMLDDQINTNSFEFFDLSVALMESSLTRAEKIFNSVIDEEIDFTKTETFDVDRDRKEFVANEAALREHWRKMVKYNTLTKVASQIQKRDHPEDYTDATNDEATEPAAVSIDEASDPNAPKSDGQIQKDAHQEVRKEFENWFRRMHKLKRNDRLSVYINSIVNVYDPHTEYFEPVEKQNFDIGMSGRLEGIGARLQTTPDGENTKVTDIITGGPAWKQKELAADDVILKVAQDGQPAVDLAGMEIDEVVSKIRGPKGTKVTLTVRKKADNAVKDIVIIRDEVIIDEGYAKSLLLKDKRSNSTIGYIYLPRFYADFDKADGHQCAADILVELEKLKKEQVEGLIIDLRGNGGGSLRDVVTMSGYFVEKGPIVQVKSRDQEPEILSDSDTKVQYSGQLIIMVNEFSASASEIMAAALQDYGRAVIVGSRTYGKGSVQRFFDLDRALRGSDDVKPLGQVKVTVQKFFRVNGGSTQLDGVMPDILLPDNWSLIESGERESDYPMPFTKIKPVEYSQDVVKITKLDRLKQKSAERTGASQVFGAIQKSAERVKSVRAEKTVSLNLRTYMADGDKDRIFDRQYKALMKPIDSFTPSNLPVDKAAITADESKKARNDEWLKDVQKDVYLFETLNIMNDMIKG